jgi:hypothetical protein
MRSVMELCAPMGCIYKDPSACGLISPPLGGQP